MKKYVPGRKIVSLIFFYLCRFLTGARAKYVAELPSSKTYIYYANHTSHLDGIIIWSCLSKQARNDVYFVAAADYWKKTRLRRYIASVVFNTILVARQQERSFNIAMQNSHQTLDSMALMNQVLDDKKSLIIFPEGTRGKGQSIAEFKSGIWHLSKKHSEISLIPIYLDNLYRVLPKGSFLAVPMICKVIIGKPIPATHSEETKQDFLIRLKESLEATKNEII